MPPVGRLLVEPVRAQVEDADGPVEGSRGQPLPVGVPIDRVDLVGVGRVLAGLEVAPLETGLELGHLRVGHHHLVIDQILSYVGFFSSRILRLLFLFVNVFFSGLEIVSKKKTLVTRKTRFS